MIWRSKLIAAAFRATASFSPTAKFAKIEWTFKKNEESPYFVNIPDTLKSLSFIEKDLKQFPNMHGSAYAQWTNDADRHVDAERRGSRRWICVPQQGRGKGLHLHGVPEAITDNSPFRSSAPAPIRRYLALVLSRSHAGHRLAHGLCPSVCVSKETARWPACGRRPIASVGSSGRTTSGGARKPSVRCNISVSATISCRAK